MAFTYTFHYDYTHTFYSFTSRGERPVSKWVSFIKEHEDPDIYELEMGDFDSNGNRLPLTLLTNNQDVFRVFATVKKIITDFLEHFPDAIVGFGGSDMQRLFIYHKRLAKIIKEGTAYVVRGIKLDNTDEDFDPHEHYKGYFVYRQL
jgi:hypothetical protein